MDKPAEVVKLVDTQRSGRCALKGVGVRVPPSAPQSVSGLFSVGLRRFYICDIHLYTATVQQRTFFSSGGFYGTKEGGSELMTSFIAFSRKHTIRVSGHCHLCFSSVRHLCAPLSAKRCSSRRSSFRRRGIAGFTLPLDVADKSQTGDLAPV